MLSGDAGRAAAQGVISRAGSGVTARPSGRAREARARSGKIENARQWQGIIMQASPKKSS